jgi:predicted membrane chloride channel (bestrophin family)
MATINNSGSLGEAHRFFDGYTNEDPLLISPTLYPLNETAKDQQKSRKLARQLQKIEQQKSTKSSKTNSYSFMELLDRERHRTKQLTKTKEILTKHFYFHLKGTVLPKVFQSWEFWLSLVIFIFARLLVSLNVVTTEDGAFTFNSSLMSVLGSFVTFFLVFYNNQIYTRFCNQYEHSMKIQGRIYNATYLIRDFILLHPTFNHQHKQLIQAQPAPQPINSKQGSSDSSLPKQDTSSSNPHPKEDLATLPSTGIAWQLVRYLNGMHLMCYVSLSDIYNRENFFQPMNDNLLLFTEEEVERLDALGMDDCGDVAFREVVAWIMTILHDLRVGCVITTDDTESSDKVTNGQESSSSKQKQHIFRLDGDVYSMLKTEIFEIRAHVGALYDFQRQPIAFVYIHLIHGLVLIYLPLFAFYIATTFDGGVEDWGTIPAALVLGVVCVFSLGLLEIGQTMAEPYGDDYSDLNVMTYVKETMHHCRRILTGHYTPVEKAFTVEACEAERMMESRRPDYGPGFGKGHMIPMAISSSHSLLSDNASDQKIGMKRHGRKQSAVTCAWDSNRHQHNDHHQHGSQQNNQDNGSFSPMFVESGGIGSTNM